MWHDKSVKINVQIEGTSGEMGSGRLVCAAH